MGAQPPSATAQEDLFAEIERLEMDAMNLALERYKFEGALLRPDEDELVVFFDLPQGISVVMNSIRLELDAKVVLDHRYRSGELEKFLRDSVQPLYVARIPNGRHVLRVRISALGGLGSNVPVLEYAFFKEPGPKFLYIALQGDTARSLRVTEW